MFNWRMTDISEHSEPRQSGLSPLQNKADRQAGYRPTRQNRSANSEKRILQAAEVLFRKNGYTHTKVSEIIKESGVSTGSFYHRFGDKEGLKEEMIARFSEAAHAQIAQLDVRKATHGSLRVMLTALAELIIDAMDENLGIYRVVDELSKTEPEKWEAFSHMGEAIRDRVCAGMHEYRAEVSVQEADCEGAAGNAVQLIIVVLLQTRLRAANMFPKARGPLIDMVVNAALGILRPEA